MKNKKSVIITVALVLAAIVIGLITYNVLTDNDKITSLEKKWINSNINTIQNVNVINDVNIFGNTGSGVFYEFINDLEREYNLQLNPVTFNYGEVVSGVTLGVKTSLDKFDKVFYEDHYVLVGKNNENMMTYSDFANKKIGVSNSDSAYISSYFQNAGDINFVPYDSKNALLEAMSSGTDIDYIIVPLTIYLDIILKNEYYIVNHLSDVKLYYTITGNMATEDTTNLSNILQKYYNKWYKENLDAYFKREEFNVFTSALGISEAEVDEMQSVVYKYGFVNNSPYEVVMGGNYGGIVAMYLYNFGEFSDLDFNFKKYKTIDKLNNAIKAKEVDLYFNYYNLQDNFYTIDSKLLVQYSVVANKSNMLVVNSLNSLAGKTVYVENGSILHNYLATIKNVNIKTYTDYKEIKKLNKEDAIILIDKNIFKLYESKELNNYSVRYSGIINNTFEFKSRTNSAFYKLFTKYVMVLDNNEMVYQGMNSYSLTIQNGSILSTIAKYILITLTVFAVIFIIFYKSSKRIKIAKRIKKEDKVKFIDHLTSIKNRNYLNENINNWNNNTIYPQTMIVVDLNNIQFINDTLGYEEGDKQIKAAANILIKTQLDNSDIMRTDGNEFLVYLVGYTQKQVTNYIHKLNKEFKKLPYNYGAEFGYSMITDGIKTVEDAVIEATEEMKSQKKKVEEGENA